MRESTIERKLRQKILAMGGQALKFVSPGMTGAPDRLVLLPGGRVCFVETKTPIGTLSERQKLVIRMIEALGFTVAVVHDDEALGWFLSTVEGKALKKGKEAQA